MGSLRVLGGHEFEAALEMASCVDACEGALAA
jgi:hypothetical protein